jgi:hypothetical protein
VIQVTRETHHAPASVEQRPTHRNYCGEPNFATKRFCHCYANGDGKPDREVRAAGTAEEAVMPYSYHRCLIDLRWATDGPPIDGCRPHGNSPPFGGAMTSSMIWGIERDVFSEFPLESMAFPVAIIVVVPAGVAGPTIVVLP